MSTIGERISQIIREKCGKKVKFARDLKIDQSYVTQLENGRRNPSERLIDDICQTYGVNREWLLIGDGEPYTHKSREEEIETTIKSALSGELDSFKARLITGLSKLDESDWVALEKLFDSIYGDKFAKKPAPTPATGTDSYALSRDEEAERVGEAIKAEIRSGGEQARESGTPTAGGGIA